MTRSDPRSDFLSGKPPSSLSLPPLPPFYPSFDPPGVSRRTRTNVTRSNVTLIRFQCKTYDPPIMVRSHLARYSAAISDPNCIRETRRSNHRYWPVSEGRVNCTSDVTLTGGGGTGGRERYNRSNVNFEPRCVRRSTLFNASPPSFPRGKWSRVDRIK